MASPIADIFLKRRLDVERTLGQRHWISPKTLAKEIGVSSENVYRLIHKGKIKGVEKIFVDNKRVYLIPDDYEVLASKKGRPKARYTQARFIQELNDKGPPPMFGYNARKYGSWLKKNRPQKFMKMFNNWRKSRIYIRDRAAEQRKLRRSE